MTDNEFIKLTIGKKIRWNSWPDNLYFIPEKLHCDRKVIGITYNTTSSYTYQDVYYIGDGLAGKGTRDAWYLVDRGAYLSNQGTEAWY